MTRLTLHVDVVPIKGRTASDADTLIDAACAAINDTTFSIYHEGVVVGTYKFENADDRS